MNILNRIFSWKIIIFLITGVFFVQSVCYSFPEALLRKPLDAGDRDLRERYDLVKQKIEKEDGVDEKTGIEKIIFLSGNRISRDDTVKALDYYSAGEMERFFIRLNKFEEHLDRLIGRYPRINEISIQINSRMMGEGGDRC